MEKIIPYTPDPDQFKGLKKDVDPHHWGAVNQLPSTKITLFDPPVLAMKPFGHINRLKVSEISQ